MKESKNENNLPMNWLNFWKYFRFPVSLILSFMNISSVIYLINLNNATVSAKTLIAILIDILILIFISVTYAFFLARKSISYKIFICYLIIIELISTPILNIVTKYLYIGFPTLPELITECAFTVVIWGLVWILPNYIYFSKREKYFDKKNDELDLDVDKIKKQEETADAKSEEVPKHTFPTSIEFIHENTKNLKINNKFIICLILIIVETTAILILGIFLFKEKSTADNQMAKIISLNSEIKEQRSSASLYKTLYNEQEDKVKFMDDHVVIVPEYTNIYHKYECQYLDLTNGGYIFNPENAEAQGYKACKHCNK
jgi:hypothetical protein